MGWAVRLLEMVRGEVPLDESIANMDSGMVVDR